MTEDEFVTELLTGLTRPPGYFPKNVLMNINGYPGLDSVLEKARQPLDADQFEAAANSTGALILDTRSADEFAEGFIPNSVNIGLDGSFANWVGELVPDIAQKILLVTDPGREEESMVRLSRVGYDNVIGYLERGFGTWKLAGKEIDSIKRISADLFEKNKYNKHILLFDVRKKSEFDSEHVIGAKNIPLNEINEHLGEFPKDRPFIPYCAGGYRSMIAASILKQRGYNNFSDVTGGFAEIGKTSIPRSAYVCPTTLL